MIPSYIIDEIKNRVDIVEVIGHYLPLKKQGVNYIALCPFHNEKTPSFNVSQTNKRYYCFGCGVSGDALQFVMDHKGLKFIDAIKILSEITGVSIQYNQKKSNNSHSENQKSNMTSQNNSHDSIETLNLLKIMEEITQMYQINLRDTIYVKEYIAKREISQESLDKFEIGYADKSDILASSLITTKNISSNALIALGMIAADADNNM
jgi:DNA primase